MNLDPTLVFLLGASLGCAAVGGLWYAVSRRFGRSRDEVRKEIHELEECRDALARHRKALRDEVCKLKQGALP